MKKEWKVGRWYCSLGKKIKQKPVSHFFAVEETQGLFPGDEQEAGMRSTESQGLKGHLYPEWRPLPSLGKKEGRGVSFGQNEEPQRKDTDTGGSHWKNQLANGSLHRDTHQGGPPPPGPWEHQLVFKCLSHKCPQTDQGQQIIKKVSLLMRDTNHDKQTAKLTNKKTRQNTHDNIIRTIRGY